MSESADKSNKDSVQGQALAVLIRSTLTMLTQINQGDPSAATVTLEQALTNQAIACAFEAAWGNECRYWTEIIIELQPPE